MTDMEYTDDIIRGIIPNIQVAAEGERPWSERLAPFLREAERFICSVMAPEDIAVGLPEPMRMEFAVWRAWRKGIPALDAVATPNGFAVVSNQTLAPASRDRVAAAVAAAQSMEDAAGVAMLRELVKVPEWRLTDAAKLYVPLFPDAGTLSMHFPEAEKLPFRFLRTNAWHIRHITGTAAMTVVSKEGMRILSELAYSADVEGNAIPPEDAPVLEEVRRLVSMSLQDPIDETGKRRQVQKIFRMLDGAEGSRVAAAWKDSAIYTALKMKPYENKKESGGYFF